MIAADVPTNFPIPFANAAGGGFIRPIPVASQIGVTPGAASLTDGFPPTNFTPVGAGGVFPFGQDFNGILNQVTAAARWTQAGGGVPQYNAAFSAAIGGYFNGAMLTRADDLGFWISTVDNNTSDPDTGGANWITIQGTAFEVVTGSRDLSTPSSVQDLTGLDFNPRAAVILISSSDAMGHPASIGFLTSGFSGSLVWNIGNTGSSDWFLSFTKAAYAVVTGSDTVAAVGSLIPSGIALDWDRTGVPTGNILIAALCFK